MKIVSANNKAIRMMAFKQPNTSKIFDMIVLY